MCPHTIQLTGVCLHLVLKCAIYTSAYHASPRCVAGLLCSDVVTPYKTYTRWSKVSAHSYIKMLYLCHTFIIFYPSNHIHQCCSPFFKHWHAVKTTTASCINDIIHYILVRAPSGHISVYTTSDMWSNSSQTTSLSRLSKCALNMVVIYTSI